MTVDDHSAGEVRAPLVRGRRGKACMGMCSRWAEGMEKLLRKMEVMLGMLIVVGGLADLEERLAAETRKARMAREWDVSIARGTEHAKAKESVKLAEKRARRKWPRIRGQRRLEGSKEIE